MERMYPANPGHPRKKEQCWAVLFLYYKKEDIKRDKQTQFFSWLNSY